MTGSLGFYIVWGGGKKKIRSVQRMPCYPAASSCRFLPYRKTQTCKSNRLIYISGEYKPLWISEKQTYLSSVCHCKTRKYTLTSFC